MRQVVLKMHISVDGFVGGPDGSVDFMIEDDDEELRDWEVDLLWGAGEHAMGSNLYGSMARFWPTSDEVYAAPMNEIPKVVFSQSLEAADWGPTRIERRPLAEAIAALKAEDGKDVLVHGGAGLALSLSRAGLIDVYHLVVRPVALGEGLSIFDTEVDLRLTHERPFPHGSVLHSYEPVAD